MKFQFKKKGGTRTYRKWSNWEIGDYVVGRLEEITEDQYNKPNYVLEVIETSFEDVAPNAMLALNSNGSLDYKMQDIEIGTVIKVSYEGEGLIEKGVYKGKTYHKVDLEVAVGSTNSNEVSEEDEDDLGL